MKTKIPGILMLLLMLQLAILAFSQDNDLSVLTRSENPETDIFNYYKALPKDSVRQRIIEKARAYIGVDYKWGESGENGFDCSGYVKYVYSKFGFTLPHSSYEQYNRSTRL